MKIIERYPTAIRMYTGAGLWGVFYPLRVIAALIYGLWLSSFGKRDCGERKRPRDVSRPSAARKPVVVSIGNMVAGGGGKTPCAMRIAEGLLTRGKIPVVVSRGYGGGARLHSPCVVPAGRAMRATDAATCTTAEELLDELSLGKDARMNPAAALGDEVILYRRRGIPVVIDANRKRGAAVAEKLFHPTHILLDDAFQNCSIEKDLDLLLLDAGAPFGNARLLPLGALRERPAAARRADAIIFTRTREARIPPAAAPFVEGKPVFFSTHEPVDLIDRENASVPLSFLEGRECVVFSGIASPSSFEDTLVSLGARPRAAFRFADHWAYRAKDIRALLRESGGGTPLIMTEKDWVKAGDLFPQDAKIYALRIEMEISGLETLLDLFSTASS